MGLFDALFGSGTKTEEIKEMLASGAVVIDVRTAQEFVGGHVKGSKNFPLQSLNSNIDKLKKMGKPLVLCCASGNRSGQAARLLEAKGITCVNGGGWRKVESMVN